MIFNFSLYIPIQYDMLIPSRDVSPYYRDKFLNEKGRPMTEAARDLEWAGKNDVFLGVHFHLNMAMKLLDEFRMRDKQLPKKKHLDPKPALFDPPPAQATTFSHEQIKNIEKEISAIDQPMTIGDMINFISSLGPKDFPELRP